MSNRSAQRWAAALGVDELDVDAHSAACALNAALENIADVQLAADLFHIAASALVVERSVARDHEGAPNAREIGGQTLADAVDEIVLLRVAGQVGEGQNDDGEARRLRPGRRRARGGDFRVGSDRIDPHRSGDVLEILFAEIDEGGIDAPANMIVSSARNENTAGLADAFEPRRYIDAVAENVLSVDQHVA